jgi:hypothetical protein
MTEVLTSVEQNEDLFEAEREEFLRDQERVAVELEVARLATRRTVTIGAPETFED